MNAIPHYNAATVSTRPSSSSSSFGGPNVNRFSIIYYPKSSPRIGIGIEIGMSRRCRSLRISSGAGAGAALESRDRVIDFGKYKGRMLGSLPSGYLKWVSKNLRAGDSEEWARLADQVLSDPVYRDRIEWEFAESVLSGGGGGGGGGAARAGSSGGAVSELVEISERFGWDNEDKDGWRKIDFALLGTSKGGRIPRLGTGTADAGSWRKKKKLVDQQDHECGNNVEKVTLSEEGDHDGGRRRRDERRERRRQQQQQLIRAKSSRGKRLLMGQYNKSNANAAIDDQSSVNRYYGDTSVDVGSSNGYHHNSVGRESKISGPAVQLIAGRVDRVQDQKQKLQLGSGEEELVEEEKEDGGGDNDGDENGDAADGHLQSPVAAAAAASPRFPGREALLNKVQLLRGSRRSRT